MDKALIEELCGCCEPEVASTPVEVVNRPGLSAIKYRVGTFSTFREAMLEAIARELALRGLTTRQSDDAAITLLELWAAVADVLTFYQERIANEAYLRTARERDSVLRLARHLDYHLRPGLAATTRLAFTLDENATTRIDVGLRVMSLPGQDEVPQIFETVEQLIAQAPLNRVRIFPIPTVFNPFAQNRANAVLLAAPSPFGAGDNLVFYSASRIEEKRVDSLTQTDVGQQLAWSPPVQASHWQAQSTHAAKYTRILRFFGYNAPSSFQKFTPSSSVPTGGSWSTVRAGETGYTFNFGAQKLGFYPLDARYEEVKPGTKLLVDTGDTIDPIRLVTVREVVEAPTTKGQLQDTVSMISVTRYLRSAPAVSSWDTTRMDVFARGGEDTCLNLRRTDSWTTWESLGGIITSAPAAVSSSASRIDLFARGHDNALLHKFWDGSDWSDWESLAGVLSSAPTVSFRAPNRLDVFARGMDRALWHISWDGSNWSSWVSRGGVLTSAPAAVSWGPDRIDVFARGLNDGLWYIRWNGANWSGWRPLGGRLKGAPAVTSRGPELLDVFVRWTNDTLRQISFNHGWGEWRSRGGVLTSDPAATSPHENRIEVFARATDFGLQNISYVSGWQGWTPRAPGMGAVPNLRRAKIYQLESPELSFQPFGYAEKITGSRVAVPLSKLSEIEKGRAVLLQDATSAATSAKVVGSSPLFTTSVGEADHLEIDLDTDLPQPLDSASAVMMGNVVNATHGETVRDEILGDGDASVPFQKFKLTKKPLTYIPSATSAKGENTLQIRINGEKWTEVESLYGQPPTAFVYTARQTDEGVTVIQFGDGVTGARVPSGRGNVIANYRHKLGLDGRLKAGQLSLPLDRPVGLKEVTNSADTEGGANPEGGAKPEGGTDPTQLAVARTAVPMTVKTFGRAVSLLDFESLATLSGEVAKAKATWVWRGLEKGVHLTVAGQRGSTFSTAALNRLHSGLTTQRDPNHILLIGNVCRAAIKIAARLVLDARYEGEKVKAEANQALIDAFAFERVDFAQPVHLSDVYRILQDVVGVVGVDIDTLHFKGYTSWTAAQLAARGATSAPVQPHLRIFAARPLSATTTNDPIVNACFGSASRLDVLPAEQAYIQSTSADITLTVVEKFA